MSEMEPETRMEFNSNGKKTSRTAEKRKTVPQGSAASLRLQSDGKNYRQLFSFLRRAREGGVTEGEAHTLTFL